MVKLVDIPDLGSGAARHGGSSPSTRTTFIYLLNKDEFFMATVTRENIGLLNDKLTLSLSKDDYLPAFEKSLKEYSKRANIPGFRKGMVPAGLIKKMYGSSLFTDEVLRSVDREIIKYLETEKLDIFGQPPRSALAAGERGNRHRLLRRAVVPLRPLSDRRARRHDDRRVPVPG